MKGQPVVRIRSLVHPEGVVGHQAANDQEEAEEDDEADKCWERQQLLSFHGLNLVTLFRHVTHRPANVGIRHLNIQNINLTERVKSSAAKKPAASDLVM